MPRSSSVLRLKCKGQNIGYATFFQGYRQLANNECFPFVGLEASQFLSNCIGPLLTKQVIHVLPHHVIVETCIYASVVKEKNTVTTPVLQDRTNQRNRKSLVSPRINKKQCRNQSRLLKARHDFLTDFLILY